MYRFHDWFVPENKKVFITRVITTTLFNVVSDDFEWAEECDCFSTYHPSFVFVQILCLSDFNFLWEICTRIHFWGIFIILTKFCFYFVRYGCCMLSVDDPLVSSRLPTLVHNIWVWKSPDKVCTGIADPGTTDRFRIISSQGGIDALVACTSNCHFWCNTLSSVMIKSLGHPSICIHHILKCILWLRRTTLPSMIVLYLCQSCRHRTLPFSLPSPWASCPI